MPTNPDTMRHPSPSGAGPGTAEWFGVSMRRRLVAFARRFVADGHEAEDIAQETLFRAGGGLSTLRSGDRAEAWLFRICRHAAIDHVRSRRVRRAVWGRMPDEAEDWALAAAEPVGAPGESDAPPELRQLPAHHRLLMALHYLRGVSQASICRRTGLSASALRVRLYRARRALLGDLGGTAGTAAQGPPGGTSSRPRAAVDRGPRREPIRSPGIEPPWMPRPDRPSAPSTSRSP